MKVKNAVIKGFVIVGMVMAMVGPALSENKTADNMKIVHEKIRADKKLFVAENMELTETEAKAFWPVYERYQDEQFLLRARTEKLIGNYADAYERMTDVTARQLLDESLTIQSLDLKVRQAYLEEFRKVLPDIKVVRYYQMESKIQAVLLYELAANIPLIKMGK